MLTNTIIQKVFDQNLSVFDCDCEVGNNLLSYKLVGLMQDTCLYNYGEPLHTIYCARHIKIENNRDSLCGIHIVKSPLLDKKYLRELRMDLDKEDFIVGVGKDVQILGLANYRSFDG